MKLDLKKSLFFKVSLLFILTLSAYWHALQGGFVWDDDIHIIRNPDVISRNGLFQIWTSVCAVYYPLSSTFFWLEYQLWGNQPFPYHLVNVLLHISNASLLWLILRHLKIRAAWVAAVLFALHPVHVESVAWITELKNLLSCFFYLLACGTFIHLDDLRNNQQTWERTRIWYGLTFLCFTLSLLSKPAAIMFPFLLLGYRWWQDKPIDRTYVLLTLPLFVIAAATAAWTIWEQKFHSGAQGAPWNLSSLERIAIAGKSAWFYLGKLIWPHPLSFIYSRWEINTSNLSSYLGFASMLLCLAFLKSLPLRWARNTLAALGFFMLMIFPVLGFFDIYFFRFSFAADHFQYLASIGPIVLLASLLRKLKGGVLLIFLILWVMTTSSGYRFRNEEMLWRRTIQTSEKAWLAHNNLGNLLMMRHDLSQAVRHYQAALRTNPHFAEAHANLATALLYLQKFDQAKHHFQTALEIDPQYAEAYNGLGIALSHSGEKEKALQHLRKAIALKPDFSEAYSNLGIEHEKQGDLNRAKEYLRFLLLQGR